ncbi:MAG: hypothetical protein LUH19_00525 [Lachnospiraceae bacterium]|nr:hypothetical protein [Lachnospiraceae bacterium]
MTSERNAVRERAEWYENRIKASCEDWCGIVGNALEIDEKEMENFLGRTDEFKAIIARYLVYEARQLTVEHHQADEDQVPPLFDHYYSRYEPLPVEEQVALLKEMIPELKKADLTLAAGQMPEGAEGYFAIPRWDALADTYENALQRMFDLLYQYRYWDICEGERKGKFFNYRAGRLSENYLRKNKRSQDMWRELCKEQPGCDILVVPAQFGLRHAGKTVRRVRETLAKNEFGLDTFAVGAMLLTHPRRVVEYDDLWMYCPGDEYSLHGDGHYDCTPLYFFNTGQMEMDVINYESFRSGSVTGFIC